MALVHPVRCKGVEALPSECGFLRRRIVLPVCLLIGGDRREVYDSSCDRKETNTTVRPPAEDKRFRTYCGPARIIRGVEEELFVVYNTRVLRPVAECRVGACV